MGNTLINKQKFFALYWGQKTGCTDYQKDMKIGKSNFQNIDYLELTPLSAITDEDAVEVGRINGNLTDNNLLVGKSIAHWLHREGKNRDLTLHAADYLRSKGYALPYMDLSVEQMVEYGWIKLKN